MSLSVNLTDKIMDYILLIILIVVILKALRNFIKGSIGEFVFKIIAKILMKNSLQLHDILLETERGTTTQIDSILIARSGVYVIEKIMVEVYLVVVETNIGHIKARLGKHIIFLIH